MLEYGDEDVKFDASVSGVVKRVASAEGEAALFRPWSLAARIRRLLALDAALISILGCEHEYR
jgi:hypothetical protein